MKKMCFIFSMFVLLCILICIKAPPIKSYEIIDIIEGDKYVLDLNGNKAKDDDEVFHLYNIDTFPLRYNPKTVQYANDYGLSINEALTLGYLGRKYARDTLLNKKVSVTSKLEKYNPAYDYRFAKLEYEEQDLGQTLLQKGLGFAYKSDEYNSYLEYEIPKKIKSAALEGLKLNVVAIDKNKKLYYKPDCEKVIYIKNINLDFLPLAEVPKDFREYIDYSKIKKPKSDFSATINKIEPPIPNIKVGEIELYLINPNNYSRPSLRCRTNACQALLKNINEAKTSIDFALYGIDAQEEIFNALIQAKKRGVAVRGLVDSKPDSTFVYKDTPKLQKALSLVSDCTNGFMHNKFFVFDSKKVFTGTMNISLSGSGGYNSNTALVINSAQIAQIYLDELSQMLEGKFQKNKTDKSIAGILLPSGTKLSIYFSPGANAYEKAIKGLIQSAQKEILVSAFYLTHRGIVSDLIAAKSRGVDVKIILDATSASQRASKVAELRDAHISLKVENWGGKSHEKNMVVDRNILITGSANFSFSGYTKNDENILIITSPSLSNFYRAHFLKLYSSIDDKYLSTNPRAESFQSKNSCYDGIDNNHDGKIDSKDDGCIRR